MARRTASTDKILKELRAFGLAYPGAHTKSPWPGHLDLAVNDKTFAYLSLEGEPLGISCKLPESHEAALMLAFTKPTAYGLGKSGWVTASFALGETPPVEMLKEWIAESYRAQAPKRLVKQLDGDSKKKQPPRRAQQKGSGNEPAAKRALAKKSAAAKTGTATKTKSAAGARRASKKSSAKRRRV